MANIASYLEQINNARYGKDVRSSIHDSIKAMNDQIETDVMAEITTAKTTALGAISSAQTTATNAIATDKGTALSAISSAKSDATGQIATDKKDATDQIATDKAAAITDIEAKRVSSLASIPDDYTALGNSVNQLNEDLAELEDNTINGVTLGLNKNIESLTGKADGGRYITNYVYHKGFLKKIRVNLLKGEQSGEVVLYARENNVYKYKEKFTVTGSGITEIIVNRLIPYDFIIGCSINGIGYSTTSTDYKSALYTESYADIQDSYFQGNLTFAIEVDMDSLNNVIVSMYGDFVGKRANFIGDSLTYGQNPDNNYEQMLENIANVAKEKLGLRISRNYGISGTLISGSSSNSFYNRRNDWEYAELNVIWGGTNDYYHGVTLGDFSTKDNTNTLYGALYKIIKHLQRYHQRTQILIVGPPKLYGTDDGYKYNVSRNGYILSDLVQCMKNVCQECNVPFLDLTSELGFDVVDNTIKSWYQPDGVHFNPLGSITFSTRKIINKIKTL